MDGLVQQGLKAAVVAQAGQEHQDLLGTLEAKGSLVQEVILDNVEIRYTINLMCCLYKWLPFESHIVHAVYD